MDLNGNKRFKDKNAKNSFNKYYTEYTEAISTHNKISNKIEKLMEKMNLLLNIIRLQKIFKLVVFSLLFFTSCKKGKDVHAIVNEFILQNVDSYDYCGYGNISFTIILSKEENGDKVLLASPSEWCSIDRNQSCGKIVNGITDSFDIIIYPLTGDVQHTKSLYLSNNITDTVKVMVKKQFYEYSLDSMNKWLAKNINMQSKIYLFNRATNQNIIIGLPANTKIKNRIRGNKLDIDSTDYRFKLVTKYPLPQTGTGMKGGQ